MVLDYDQSQRNLTANKTLNTFKNLLIYLLLITGELNFTFTT
jgi:hypothetical protein